MRVTRKVKTVTSCIKQASKGTVHTLGVTIDIEFVSSHCAAPRSCSSLVSKRETMIIRVHRRSQRFGSKEQLSVSTLTSSKSMCVSYVHHQEKRADRNKRTGSHSQYRSLTNVFSSHGLVEYDNAMRNRLLKNDPQKLSERSVEK